MKKFVIALCLTLFAVPISLAGQAEHLELNGFSRNGAFVAFTRFGIASGSGFPYLYTSFVSVKKNRLEAEVGNYSDIAGATMGQVRAKTGVQIAAEMKRYGIVAGNQGRFIGVTPPLMNTMNSEFFALDRTYGLSIATKPTVNVSDDCFETPQLLILKLTVNGQPRDLQRDTRLPISRGCAYGYEMRSAHLHGRSLAVFVSYQTPAPFASGQGASSGWMVVTGML